MNIPLPHGATIEDEKQVITLDLGMIQLKFSFEEWEDFVEIISDIDSVFQSKVSAEAYKCPSCGTAKSFYDYNEPDEDEYN